MLSLKGLSFFCSWSGGKDSCLALFHALRAGGKPAALFTMMAEDGIRSRSHALPRPLLKEQARRLGIPIVFRCSSWSAYEKVFAAALEEFRADGIDSGIFGDIDVEDHRNWCLRVCQPAGIHAVHPLWKRPRRELLEEFITLGFRATIVVTDADKLGPEWLGRTIDHVTVSKLIRAGVDPSGELGEYHTLVTDGPIFQSKIALKIGEPVLHEGYWFLEMKSKD